MTITQDSKPHVLSNDQQEQSIRSMKTYNSRSLHHEMIKDDLSSKLEITSACNFVIFKDTYSFFNKKLTVSLICLFVKTWVKNVAKMTTKWIISLHYYVICQVADIITGLGIQLVGQSCNCYHPRPQVADSGTTFRYGGQLRNKWDVTWRISSRGPAAVGSSWRGCGRELVPLAALESPQV